MNVKFLKKYEIYLSNYKNFLPDIKSLPDKVSEMELAKIYNVTIFARDSVLGVSIYFVSVGHCYLIDIWLS